MMLILLIQVSLSCYSSLAMACPSGCVCLYGTMAICQSNFLHQIPTGFPPTIESLYLDQNLITSIRKGDLDGLPNLQTLSLAMNEISTIEDDVFINQPNLKTMLLNRNRIQSLRAEMFNGLENLEKLVLDRQHGPSLCIDDRAFSNLTNLQELSLISNNLLSRYQWGFRAGRSTELLLLSNTETFRSVVSIFIVQLSAGIDVNLILRGMCNAQYFMAYSSFSQLGY